MDISAILGTKDTVEKDQDVLGGYAPLETDIYKFTIEYAYLHQAASEAIALAVKATSDTGKVFNQQIYMTSGKEKGKKNTFIDSRTGKERYLPGFVTANSLARLTTGNEIAALTIEKKTILLPDRADNNKEKPKEVPMYVDLIGKSFYGAIMQKKTNRRVQGDAGSYVPTNDVQIQVELTKIFDAETKQTVNEKVSDEPATFFDKWLEKNKGTVLDQYKPIDTGVISGPPGLGNSKPSNSNDSSNSNSSNGPTTGSIFD